VTALGGFGGTDGREGEATGDATGGGDIGGLGTGGAGREGDEETCLEGLEPEAGPDSCFGFE
jgi:hypothetical protein